MDFLRGVYQLNWLPLGIWVGEKLVGLFPVMSRHLGPFRLAGSPLMQVIASTPFLGPVAPPEYFNEILLALNRFFHRHRFAHSEIFFPYRLAPSEIGWVQTQGYTTETCEAVFLRLEGRTSQQLWGGLSSSCRRAIRKAQANGVKIVIPHERSFLEHYVAMCKEVYQDSDRLPHLSESFYRSLWDTLTDSGMVHWALATYQGQIIAGAVFLLHHQYACYLSGASFNKWQHLRPNNLIQWYFIEWATLQGYANYDMGGATIPGITRFKLSFGGELVSYTRLHQTRTPLARLGRKIYQTAIPK